MSGYTSTRPYLIRALHEWMGDNALTAHIVVDALVPGVQVPPGSVRDGQVILNISMQATHRLELGNEALRFAARFGGREQWVEVPVDAVIAIFARENGQGMSFDSAAAQAGSVELGDDVDPHTPSADLPEMAPESILTTRPRGVSSDPPASPNPPPPDDSPPEGPAPAPPRGRPSLKVVK